MRIIDILKSTQRIGLVDDQLRKRGMKQVEGDRTSTALRQAFEIYRCQTDAEKNTFQHRLSLGLGFRYLTTMFCDLIVSG